MSVMSKINEVAEENKFTVCRVKYLDSCGFAKVFFKVKKFGSNTYIPAFIFPVEGEMGDEEDLFRFKSFLSKYDMNRYFDLENLSERDMQSILAVIKCADNESLSLIGKKKPHEDKNESYFFVSLTDRIERSLEPLRVKLAEDCREGNIVCFYNESEDVFCAISDDSEGYDIVLTKFDEAYKHDVAQSLKQIGV